MSGRSACETASSRDHFVGVGGAPVTSPDGAEDVELGCIDLGVGSSLIIDLPSASGVATRPRPSVSAETSWSSSLPS